MVFSGLTFLLLFFPTVMVLSLLSRRLKYQNYMLLAVSLLFYAWGEPKWVLAMLAVAAMNYLCALPLQKDTLSKGLRRLLLTAAVLGSLSFLFYFKYAAFFLNTFGSLIGRGDLMKTPVLPIGISFYTFQALTYTVDVYRGKAPAQRNPLKLLLYISCFPQLIAGPIVQYADIAEQLDRRKITADGYLRGFRRFTVGLAKKVLLANLCGSALLEMGTAAQGPLTVVGAWVSCILYSMQIYFDFSAYSDMAIGIGSMLGFRYKENFNYPYIAGSVTEFWHRWHISLGSFFRDYVYIPLGGNRKGPARQILNLLIVWGLTGFWHGASWNYLMWGLLHGVLVVAEKMIWKKEPHGALRILRRVLSLILVLISMMVFYYENLSFGLSHILAFFGIGLENGVLTTVPWIDEKRLLLLGKYALPIAAMIVFCTPLLKNLAARWEQRDREKPCGYEIAAGLTSVALLVLSLICLIGQSYNPFIYFRF